MEIRKLQLRMEGDEGLSARLSLNEGQRLVLGRSKDCDFVLSSDSVSSHHLAIEWTGNEILIEDLQSANGTFREPQGSRIERESFPPLYPELSLKLGTFAVRLSWLREGSAKNIESTDLIAATQAKTQFSQVKTIASTERAPAKASPQPEPKPHAALTPTQAEAQAEVPPAAPPKVDLPISDQAIDRSASALALLALAFLGRMAWAAWGPLLFGRLLLVGPQLLANGGAADLAAYWLWLVLSMPWTLGVGAIVLIAVYSLSKRLWKRLGIARFLAPLFEASLLGRLPWRLFAIVVGAWMLVWPGFVAWRFGVGPEQWSALITLRDRMSVPKDIGQDPLVERIDALHELAKQFPGSAFVYKALLNHQRTRILNECEGTGEQPWPYKRTCLLLLAAAANETYIEVHPAVNEEIALRVSILSVLDGVTRAVTVDGLQAAVLPLFTTPLDSLGLEREREDIEKILREPALTKVEVYQLLLRLRRQVESAMDSRQREMKIPAALRLHVSGPLESGI